MPSLQSAEVQQAGSTASGCELLEKKVGSKCLTSLLGIGTHRLRRLQGGGPDLRFGHREYKSKPGTWTIDSFLQTAYNNIAETLPDQFLLYNVLFCCFFNDGKCMVLGCAVILQLVGLWTLFRGLLYMFLTFNWVHIGLSEEVALASPKPQLTWMTTLLILSLKSVLTLTTLMSWENGCLHGLLATWPKFFLPSLWFESIFLLEQLLICTSTTKAANRC